MSDAPNLKAIQADDLIVILKRVGLTGDIAQMFLNDIDAGFTLNEDDTINIVEYCAWLMMQSSRRIE